ncbi:hypothetical protein GmHk_04G010269 [Glycine max]|nr:hypothetical protein GmHk_04G010269 [Glycine max]
MKTMRLKLTPEGSARVMGTLPRSPSYLDWHSELMSRKSRQSTRLRRPNLISQKPQMPRRRSTNLGGICCKLQDHKLKIRKKAHEIQKYNDGPHILSCGGYDLLEKNLLDEKRKKRQQETMLTENTPLIKDPPSPIERHVKWKLARTKRYGQMTSQAA